MKEEIKPVAYINVKILAKDGKVHSLGSSGVALMPNRKADRAILKLLQEGTDANDLLPLLELSVNFLDDSGDSDIEFDLES